MSDVLNEIYLPFSEEQLRERFAPVGTDETSADRHLDYYRKSVHALEGATKVDAMLIAPGTGFAVLFEAKVLADASCGIGFDVLRNQLARNIDVMLQPNPEPAETADATAA